MFEKITNVINDAPMAGNIDDAALEALESTTAVYQSLLDGSELEMLSDTLDSGFGQLEAAMEAIKTHGISAPVMDALTDELKSFAFGENTVAMESLGATGVHDHNCEAALEGMSDALKKMWTAVKNFFVKVAKWVKDMVTRLIDMFRNNEKVILGLRDKIKKSGSPDDKKLKDTKVKFVKGKELIEAVAGGGLEEGAEFVATVLEIAANSITKDPAEMGQYLDAQMQSIGKKIKKDNIFGLTYDDKENEINRDSDKTIELGTEEQSLAELKITNKGAVENILTTAYSAQVITKYGQKQAKNLEKIVKEVDKFYGKLDKIDDNNELAEGKKAIGKLKHAVTVAQGVIGMCAKVASTAQSGAISIGRAYLRCCD